MLSTPTVPPGGGYGDLNVDGLQAVESLCHGPAARCLLKCLLPDVSACRWRVPERCRESKAEHACCNCAPSPSLNPSSPQRGCPYQQLGRPQPVGRRRPLSAFAGRDIAIRK